MKIAQLLFVVSFASAAFAQKDRDQYVPEGVTRDRVTSNCTSHIYCSSKANLKNQSGEDYVNGTLYLACGAGWDASKSIVGSKDYDQRLDAEDSANRYIKKQLEIEGFGYSLNDLGEDRILDAYISGYNKAVACYEQK